MKLNSAIKEDLKKRLINDIEKQKERVYITSSYNLTEDDKKLLYSKIPELQCKDVVYSVDQRLIAGIRIQIGSQIIDLSLSQRLQNLKLLLYEIN